MSVRFFLSNTISGGGPDRLSVYQYAIVSASSSTGSATTSKTSTSGSVSVTSSSKAATSSSVSTLSSKTSSFCLRPRCLVCRVIPRHPVCQAPRHAIVKSSKDVQLIEFKDDRCIEFCPATSSSTFSLFQDNFVIDVESKQTDFFVLLNKA